MNYPWHFNTMQYNGNHRAKISPFILKITPEMCFQLSRCKKRCKIAFLHGEIWKIHREIFFGFFLWKIYICSRKSTKNREVTVIPDTDTEGEREEINEIPKEKRMAMAKRFQPKVLLTDIINLCSDSGVSDNILSISLFVFSWRRTADGEAMWPKRIPTVVSGDEKDKSL